MTDYAVNIQNVYRRATETDIREGMTWYGDAHEFALSLDPHNVWRAAGVIAAFSPRQPWSLNKRNAVNAFATGQATGHTRVMCGIAQRILDGEHTLDVLKGDKTRSFAEAIATAGNGTIATVDRHAYDVAMNEYGTDATRKIGKVLYREIALAYGEVAEYNAVSVNQIQAVTWVVWRRMKGVWEVWG